MTVQHERPTCDDDRTTLHDDDDHEIQVKPTPLPKFQLMIIFLVQFSEPITATVIYPFVNQFVRDTGITNGDEKKTGYYAGTIESMFFLAECLTVIQWGYLSDRYGRRKILLFGPLGLAFSMFMFGLSTTFWPLVVFRCLQGAFNGNIGVSRSAIAEITDSTNIGDAYAYGPLMWSLGSTIAPLMGGVLSNPAKNWPDTLGRIALLRVHPYFLPCAASSSIAFITFVIAFFGLKETLPSMVAKEKLKINQSDVPIATSTTSLIDHRESIRYGTENIPQHSDEISENPTLVGSETNPALSRSQSDFRSILTRPLLMIYLTISFLNFVEMGNFVLIPLMYSTPVEYGGLGLDPFHIGVAMGVFGLVNSAVQANFIGRLIRKFGPRRLYQVGYSNLLVSFCLFPIMKYFVRRSGRVDATVVALITLQLGLQMMTYMAFGSCQVLLVQNIPEGGPLGTINGVAQMSASGMRAISPTFTSSLFAISLQRNLAGGNMVYYVLFSLAVVGVVVSLFLPYPMKQKDKRRSRPSSR